MSTLIVNRKRNEDPQEERTIPGNSFVIKEGNTDLFIISVLKDHPLTIGFSSELIVNNGAPTPNETTFDFGSFDLTTQQEADALSVITEFRDKNAFTPLEQLNISAQSEINDAIEQLGDIFNEDNIGELMVPDVCSIRDQFEVIYSGNDWNSFSVGEKRILIADWLIPTLSERTEIFQGGVKRQEIYKLFASKMNDLSGLEFIRSLSSLADDQEGAEFTKLFKRILSPGKTDLKNQVFISRSSAASLSATTEEVDVPVFGNIRTNAGFITVLSDVECEMARDAEVDLGYSCTVQANGNTNHQIKVTLNDDDIDFQGMKRDGRGRDTLDHLPLRVSLSKGDKIKVKLNNINAGTGNVVAQSGKCMVRIEEVLK